MEEKKTVFNYLSQVLIVFGFAILTMNIFCLAFGNSAKGLSPMFALGSRGLPIETVFQFLLLSAIIIGLRFVFFTDIFIKKMPIYLRTICMLTSVIIIMTAFIAVFHWFPINMWQPWVMFFICFIVSFLGSYFVMILKEKTENKRMAEALQRLKETEGK